MNPDGLEMFISILERLDFTYFRSILCLDMPIMTCPSGGVNKPFYPFLRSCHHYSRYKYKRI